MNRQAEPQDREQGQSLTLGRGIRSTAATWKGGGQEKSSQPSISKPGRRGGVGAAHQD